MKIEKGNAELVIWEDIYSSSAGWLDPSDKEYKQYIDRDEDFIAKQIGFVVKETDTHIVLASTVVEDNGMLSQLTRLPKSVIKSRTRVVGKEDEDGKEG